LRHLGTGRSARGPLAHFARALRRGTGRIQRCAYDPSRVCFCDATRL